MLSPCIQHEPPQPSSIGVGGSELVEGTILGGTEELAIPVAAVKLGTIDEVPALAAGAELGIKPDVGTEITTVNLQR